MKKIVLNIFVISLQLLIVGLFFMTVFSEKVNITKKVSIVDNENLDKIADSVSLLFISEETPLVDNEISSVYVDMSSLDEKVEEEKVEENKEENKSLTLLNTSLYKSNPDLGFVVTDDNKTYTLPDDEFNLVVAVVAAEYEKSIDDALAVISVILNRCESPTWSEWAGTSPAMQVVKPNQFEVYSIGSYLKYMPGGAFYGTNHYKLAKQAVIDAFNGIRNNNYYSFRSWSYITSGGDYYSYNYIVEGGNRYN